MGPTFDRFREWTFRADKTKTRGEKRYLFYDDVEDLYSRAHDPVKYQLFVMR